MVDPNTSSVKIQTAIYTRKSLKADTENDANSLEVQRRIAESYIRSHPELGLNCLEERFDDDNQSGAKDNRPALNRLFYQVEQGLVKAVVIVRLDRLSRRVDHCIEILAFFKKHGVSLYCVTQEFKDESPVDKFRQHIQMAVDQYERENSANRVRESIHAARKLGNFTGGCPPLGYDICTAGGALVVNELEALQVREIFETFTKEGSIRATLTELNQRDFRNKKWIARKGKVCGGRPFSYSGLHHFLRNPVFTGKVRLKGETYPGKHEAIVDQDLFDQVQATLTSNSVQKNNKARNIHAAILKGTLHCTACNCSFSHTYTRKKGRMYRYYTCTNKKKNGAHLCPTPSLPAGELESLITDQLMSVGTDPALQDSVYQQVVETLQQKRDQQIHNRQVANRQLERLNLELESALQLHGNQPQIDQLRVKRNDAERMFMELKNCVIPQIPERSDITKALQDMHALWPSFTATENASS